MRVRRSSTVALLASALLPLLAVSASATDRGPAGREEGLHLPRLSCSGDTLHVTGVVRGVRDLGPVTLEVQGRSGTGPWTAIGLQADLPSSKPGRRTWPLNIVGVPAAVTSFRVAITTAGRTVQTPVVASASCAPGTEVPEVPIAPLVPLTLALTASGLLAVRSRRTVATSVA